jgi:hypothetical protein
MFDPVHSATWWFGALLGLLHVAVALMVLLPLLPGVHPRMASHRAKNMPHELGYGHRQTGVGQVSSRQAGEY